MFSLKGKIALVTGSSRGIGRGIALNLAQAGADIVVNYVSSRAEAEVVQKEILALGVRCAVVQANVSLEADVSRLFGEIKREFGRLDILINNAGTSHAQTIFETSLEDWNQLIANNLTSTFLCSKYAMEMMKDQKWGRIVQISSIVAHQGALFGHVHYAATKGGQLSFTKTLARTAAPLGITVNAIAPGIIGTELLTETHGQDGIEKLAKGIPLGLGELSDIGHTAVFLCSEESKYITGSTIDVNGGMYLR